LDNCAPILAGSNFFRLLTYLLFIVVLIH
jgi:hypothetical protein